MNSIERINLSTMDDPIITEIHERKSHMLIRSRELNEIIKHVACEKCGIPYSDAVRFEITFEDESAGSPSYKAGTRVRVTVIENQLLLKDK